MSVQDIVSTSENSVLFNVFQLPLLSNEKCQELTKTILAHRHTHPHEGSMQKYTVNVSSFLGDFLKETLENLIPSINNLFYFGKETAFSLYTAHAVYYSAEGEGEKELRTHVDDSDITINITLMTESLSGCEVRFLDSTEYGNEFCIKHFGKMKEKLDAGMHLHSIKPEVGTCLLHFGHHPHLTSPIYSGKRLSLILWLKKKNEVQ
jgi:hypothetical protein